LANELEVAAGVAVGVPVLLWLAVLTVLVTPVSDPTEDVTIAFDDFAATVEPKAGPLVADESYGNS
jgi:hypothetical protein